MPITPDIDELVQVTKEYANGHKIVLYADPSSSLPRMRREHPLFFETPHGRREVFIPHRGGLIACSTDVHCSNQPVRRRSVFLRVYDDEDDQWMMWSVDSVDSVRQGKRMIDEILKTGVLPSRS